MWTVEIVITDLATGEEVRQKSWKRWPTKAAAQRASKAGVRALAEHNAEGGYLHAEKAVGKLEIIQC